MGIKLLIIAACTIAGAEVSTHADVADVVEVESKDEAVTLARMGRALYLDKAQDPQKGALTATAEDKELAKRSAKAIRESLEIRAAEAAATSPAGMAAMVAAEVAKAVQAALAAKAPTPA